MNSKFVYSFLDIEIDYILSNLPMADPRIIPYPRPLDSAILRQGTKMEAEFW